MDPVCFGNVGKTSSWLRFVPRTTGARPSGTGGGGAVRGSVRGSVRLGAPGCAGESRKGGGQAVGFVSENRRVAEMGLFRQGRGCCGARVTVRSDRHGRGEDAGNAPGERAAGVASGAHRPGLDRGGGKRRGRAVGARSGVSIIIVRSGRVSHTKWGRSAIGGAGADRSTDRPKGQGRDGRRGAIVEAQSADPESPKSRARMWASRTVLR